MADFPRVEKIDAHMHVIGAADRLMAQAIADDFRILTINTDYPDFPPIPEQQAAAESLRRRYPGRVAFAATFSVANFNAPGWASVCPRGYRDCPGSRGGRSEDVEEHRHGAAER